MIEYYSQSSLLYTIVHQNILSKGRHVPWGYVEIIGLDLILRPYILNITGSVLLY